MYRERSSRLLAATVWRGSVAGAPGGTVAQRVLPDGCMDVVWADGRLLVAGPDTVAAESGYADQPHLARDIRALAGVPLGELVRQSG